MEKLKRFVKKYFTSFSFFYGYLRHRIFIAFMLSVSVSFMDALGLTMFFPLLQVVDEGSTVDASEMGKLGYLVEGIEGMGIAMTVGSVLLIMFIFFSLKGVAQYVNSVYQVVLKQRFIRSIRLNLLKRLNVLSFKHFITSDVGRIQNTLTGEVSRVSRSFSSYFKTFQKALMVLVYMSFAFAANAQFAILVFVGGGLTNFLYRILYKHTKGASRKLTTYNSRFQGQIIQHVAHFKYLRATGMAEKYSKKLKATIYKIEKSRRKIGVLKGISSAAREPMLVAVIAIVIFVQVKMFGGTIGAIMVSLLFFYRALTSLVALQEDWNRFMEVSGSLENMQDFHKELGAGREKKGKIKIKEFKRGIQLKDVSFAYGNTPILHNINLDVQKNQSVAFVGESGSGKTTLVNLISGLLPESEGHIYIDKTPLKKVNKTTYQERIGYVSQDPVVFNDTIYNNVTFWAPKTPENIKRFEESIKEASLESFIDELPNGKETHLGNNGINLSGGQKQRVSIARELYKDIDILILDEATSALDSETEKAIQKSIDALKGQYTILLVAHRLSTIRNADSIVFMDKGHIIDVDDFESLVKKQERFKKMVALQEL